MERIMRKNFFVKLGLLRHITRMAAHGSMTTHLHTKPKIKSLSSAS